MNLRKVQFLEAVVGHDGAMALAKSAERAKELDQAIFPRAVISWLETIAPIGYEGSVPGVEESKFSVEESEDGYSGSILLGDELHKFEDVSINHVAGCVAVALDLDHERVSQEATPGQLAKLGKAIDLLVKTQLVKTSWNVKQQRSNVTRPQAVNRFAALANNIGLQTKPSSIRGVTLSSLKNKGNTVSYAPENTYFNIDHEMGHAAMTPPGSTLEEHQAKIDKLSGAAADDDDEAADYVAQKLARRAGLNKIPGSGGIFKGHQQSVQKLGPAVKQHIAAIDSGAKFDSSGRLNMPTGIDAKINARALGKVAIKPNTNDRKISLPGQAAKPIEPKAAIAPIAVQPSNQKQTPMGAAGTSQAAPMPKLPGVKQKPSLSVTKSESNRKCRHCLRSQFTNNVFTGCICYAGLAKSTKTIGTKDGYKIEFGSGWDQDAVLTIIKTFKGK